MYMTKKQKLKQAYALFYASLGLTVFTAIFLAVFIFTNWQAVRNEVGYTAKPQTQPIVIVSPSPTAEVTPTPAPIVETAHVIIEKIGVDVPISWDVAPEETVDYLDNGVAHMKGTAHLGEEGNLFITGHSSDYVWKRNPYAAVFSLLPKLEIGDIIRIRENGKVYVYKVAQTQIVNPDQVDVINQTTTPVVTLMTCYPVGTTKERYVVQAALVSAPDPINPAKQVQSTHLPEIKFR